MKIKPNYLALLTISALISSCGLLGPDYTKPNVTAPTNWTSKDSLSVNESTNIAEMAWWRKFNDPQLNGLIESAFTNNNNLQMAMGNMLQAQAQLGKVNMGWVPTANIGAGGAIGQMFDGSFTNHSSNPIPSTSNNFNNFNSYGYGIMPSYTLNVFEQIKQGEIATLNLAMQQQAIYAVRLGIISQVSSSYFALLGFHRQLEIQEETLRDAEELRKLTLIQYEKGSISDLKVSALDQYIATIKANIPILKTNITNAENALQLLTNQNPAKIKLDNNFNKISTNNIIPVNLPSDVLKARPDVVAAEYQLQLANANIGAVRSMFFPSINLTGALGQGSMNLANLFSAGGDFWMTQLGAAMPFFNMSLYKEVDIAKSKYYTAYYNYVQTVRSAFSDVDNGLSAHDSSTSNYNEQTTALNRAQDIYKNSNKRYQKGAIAYVDLIGTKLNIDYSLANQNKAKMNQLNSLVSLYQALGGGYMAESSLTQIKKFNDGHDI